MLEANAGGGADASAEASATSTACLDARLAALPTLTSCDLRAEWRRSYRSNPPKKISRDLLELGVAWKLQEAALGGLGPSGRRRLADLARTMATEGDLKTSRAATLRPGARLIREWHGETHDVLVLEEGFSWRGKQWRSLSAIAREITGTPWSGPRFFGLQKSMPSSERTALATRSRTESGTRTDA